MCLLGQKTLDGKCLRCVVKNVDVWPLELENNGVNVLVGARLGKMLVFVGDCWCVCWGLLALYVFSEECWWVFFLEIMSLCFLENTNQHWRKMGVGWRTFGVLKREHGANDYPTGNLSVLVMNVIVCVGVLLLVKSGVCWKNDICSLENDGIFSFGGENYTSDTY